ncbi:hypothetical protein [Paracoccus sp. IB05]|uniref:hypothetical protein n=1 Tax=Paracoccus sp. IB05 TaxID=2779367 RepID=UPI0018E7FF0B|nr:hypothetical protein [Paracoccus sp. IB05]MBJ2152838.1 hypothetical protein [Paracoccus sp. IB05]
MLRFYIPAGIAAMALTGAVAAGLGNGPASVAPEVRAAVSLTPAPPSGAAVEPATFRTCFLDWAEETPLIALRDGFASTGLSVSDRVLPEAVLLTFRAENERTQLEMLDLRALGLADRQRLATAAHAAALARHATEARAVARKLARAREAAALAATRHREGRLDRLSLELAEDQLAEVDDLAAQTAPALALLEAEHALRLTELQQERAALASERKVLQDHIGTLSLRSEAAGAVSFVAPALTTGALVAVRRGEHVISLARPGMFRAKVPVHLRDLSLFTDRRVTARLALEAGVLTGQVTHISALRSPLPDGSTHEVEIRFDPTALASEPQSASCLFEIGTEAAP